jgi:hypothetical protein
MTTAQNIPLKFIKSDVLGDWWLIERADHDGSEWFEPTEYGTAYRKSSRLGRADIEGSAYEMRAIASAIEAGVSEGFKRCAVEWLPDGAVFSSPRNSNDDTVRVTHENARDLAAQIRSALE